MLKRSTKALFYFLFGPIMRINGIFYRRFRSPNNINLRVHLGPGKKNYIQGWLNLDANIFTGKCDVWVDLSNPLPFRDSTVDAVYSHHVVEHLPDLDFHFSEIHRCLKPGGAFRIGVPNGDEAVRMFSMGKYEWFSDFPEKRSSIGGRLNNFFLCKNEHLHVLTKSYFEELIANSKLAFSGVCLPGKESFFPEKFVEVFRFEQEPTPEAPHTLIVEGRKT